MKIRIALAIDPTGTWSASGWGSKKYPDNTEEAMDTAIDGVGKGEQPYWIEVEVEPPITPVIQAEAKAA